MCSSIPPSQNCLLCSLSFDHFVSICYPFFIITFLFFVCLLSLFPFIYLFTIFFLFLFPKLVFHFLFTCSFLFNSWLLINICVFVSYICFIICLSLPPSQNCPVCSLFFYYFVPFCYPFFITPFFSF